MKLADQSNAGSKMGPTSLGAASESDSSTTRSGISGAALTIGGITTRTDKSEASTDSHGKTIYTAITTGTDTAAKLAKPSSLEDIQAQVQIVQSFGSQAAKAVGDYAQTQTDKAAALHAQAKEAEQAGDPTSAEQRRTQATEIERNWGDNGTARVAAHALIGGLTGGVGGAAGAAAGTLTAPAVAQALHNANITGPLADVLTAVASTAVGATVGGTGGAAAAGNEVVNNFMQHQAKFKANVNACKSNPSAVGCGDYAAMANGTSTAIGKVAGYDVVAVVGSDGRPVAYTVGTGDNAMVMQPTDYAAFTKMPASQQQQLMAQYTQAQLNDTSVANSGFNVLKAQTREEQAANVRLIVSCPAGDCNPGQAMIQGAAGTLASVVGAVKEGALTLVDVAGKSSAIQADAELGTSSAKDYKPVSAIGQSIQDKGLTATASDMVDGIWQLPASFTDAANKGNYYDTTKNLMDAALVVDGAASVTKAGVGLVREAVQADAAAAKAEAIVVKTKVENNLRADDTRQYDQYRKPDSVRPGGEWDWDKQAPNGGAVSGTQQVITLEKGIFLDRYGSENGTYLSPNGTTYEARALPPGSKSDGYNQYRVDKPFSVEKSDISPAFDQLGGGIQYRVTTPSGQRIRVNVDYLVKNGYLIK